MKIGVMLRAIDERQGIGIYSANLMDKLIPLDRKNEYALFYRNPAHLGRYAAHSNVKEFVVRAPGKAAWDQIAVPAAARRHGVDVIFHTKFTVPLFTAKKTVMTVHGASWFVHPDLYGKLDVAYVRSMMPLYCWKASAILSNSELTTRDFMRILGVDPAKLHTVRLGTHERFRRIDDDAELQRARERWHLPERFIFAVVKHDPRKNFGNLIAAFRLCRRRVPCKLVVAGIGCEKYAAEYRLHEDGTSRDVSFLGWVGQEDLPALYNLARCLFFPSVYEEFGIPTCEAMACGCPVVVSNTGALPEVAGNAGVTVDPFNPAQMADALERMFTDDEWREDLRAKAIERARMFTWSRCAEETLVVLNSLDSGN